MPPALQSNDFGEHKYARVNGIKIHYVEKGSPDKPLIVFVHGFPEFWYSWRHQITEFSKDYWCVALDMRGYGDSDKPEKVSDYTIPTIAEDIKELVKYLGRDTFTLVAHDWGGVVGFYFVDKLSYMLDNYIILSSTSMPIWGKLVMTEWWQFRHAWYVFFYQNPIVPEMLMSLKNMKIFDRAMRNKDDPTNKVTKEDVDAFYYTFPTKESFTPPINYYRANFGREYAIPPPENIPKGLFVLGEFDDYITPSTCVALMKRYKGLQSQILKNGRHFIQQEHPEPVNEIMRDFLKKQTITIKVTEASTTNTE